MGQDCWHQSSDYYSLPLASNYQTIGEKQMVVLALICHDEHRRIIQAPFNMLPSWAAPHTTAFVVTPAFYSRKQ
jgi:hypothetical protein